jgi:hypothetical protein
MSKLYKWLFSFISVLLLLLLASCLDNEEMTNEKISSLLITQVNLKKEQINDPNDERLILMKEMGMQVDNLENQIIFIHLDRELNEVQIKELQNIGLILNIDSWIPPVGVHSTGYVIADMPVDALYELAEIEYIIKIDTAERMLKLQNGSGPQVK